MAKTWTNPGNGRTYTSHLARPYFVRAYGADNRSFGSLKTARGYAQSLPCGYGIFFDYQPGVGVKIEGTGV